MVRVAVGQIDLLIIVLDQLKSAPIGPGRSDVAFGHPRQIRQTVQMVLILDVLFGNRAAPRMMITRYVIGRVTVNLEKFPSGLINDGWGKLVSCCHPQEERPTSFIAAALVGGDRLPVDMVAGLQQFQRRACVMMQPDPAIWEIDAALRRGVVNAMRHRRGTAGELHLIEIQIRRSGRRRRAPELSLDPVEEATLQDRRRRCGRRRRRRMGLRRCLRNAAVAPSHTVGPVTHDIGFAFQPLVRVHGNATQGHRRPYPPLCLLDQMPRLMRQHMILSRTQMDIVVLCESVGVDGCRVG